MGCDIHVRVYRSGVLVPPCVEKAWGTEYAKNITDRDYHLFAFLADVRQREPEVKPAFAGRSLPSFIDPRTTEEDPWLGDHSYTYFTAEELLNTPLWDQPYSAPWAADAKTFRDITGEEWRAWATTLRPDDLIVIGFDS